MITYLRNVLILLTFIIPNSSFAQENKPSESNLIYINKFVKDLNNTNIATDVILSQYITITNELTDEYFEYLQVSLDEVRLNIQMKDISQIQYINYFQLPKKETRDIDLEGKNANNIYFLKIKDRLVVALYLDAGKIASFTLVSKGDNLAHFVTY
ncbi:hypothetical protein LZQ00_12935 [Sphingobacterium sp. SRCM116780]|uniref:hypothetical protein n=1 Tax=Sphingobacterium sp. SRCM116780 TaxID=2907623 RepID=UPI001F27FC2F|nr:hypothetical protein [Sphingobacterium sp. SRCM116780]UIR55174.1 hypothetical protein LZQ00_12935 [Sphingobacterium sp. SRCM116780]